MAYTSLLERLAKKNAKPKRKKKSRKPGRSKRFVNGNGRGPTKKRRRRIATGHWLS